MAAALVQAQYDELEALAQRFGERAERIDAMRQQLQAALAPLQQGGWIGEGSQAFFSEMGADLLPGAARLTEALGAAQAVTLQCNAILRAAEEEAAALFRDWAIDGEVKAGGVGAGAPVLGGGGSGGGGGGTAPVSAPPGTLPGGPAFDASGKLIRFDLTADEFEMLNAKERLQWVSEMEKLAGGPWFHNIADIITFFDESPTLRHMGPGTWASWADAGVLEAIQNGWVQSRGGVPVSPSGGAADKWADFFNGMGVDDEATLRSKWAMAEQAGVNYGATIADDPARGGRPVGLEGTLIENFVAAGNVYRAIARIPNGGAQFGGNIGEGVGSTTGGAAGSGLGGAIFGPAGSWLGGELGGWLGGGAGREAGEASGDWFTDPRSTVPGSNHGPTYYSAKLVEQATLLSAGGPISIPLLPPIPGKPGSLPLPPGFTIGPGGTVTLPSGARVDIDGSIVMSGGARITPGGTVISSGGAVVPLGGTRINPDGSLTLSDGTIER